MNSTTTTMTTKKRPASSPAHGPPPTKRASKGECAGCVSCDVTGTCELCGELVCFECAAFLDGAYTCGQHDEE